jgi:multimeric flavodoxin WrbA
MKIVAIMGSPRGRGAGFKVVQQVEERMKTMGTVEFEYVFLKDADLKPCIGCFNCVTKGEDKCPLKDDRAAIEKKLLEADGVILSSPGYVQNVSWLMKNFMDRFAYTNHRLRFFGQKGMMVVNSGGAGLNEAIKCMEIALGGLEVVSRVGAGTPPWPQTENAKKKKQKLIEDEAVKFYRAMAGKKLRDPTFMEYVRFAVQKTISGECRQWLPADYEFYKGKEYFYEARVGAFKKLMAGVMLKIMFTMMKDMGPGPAEPIPASAPKAT